MFAWVFILAAVLVGGVLGWKPALARYYVYKLETGADAAADQKLRKLGPAAIPVLVGAIGSGRKPEAEPELSSILRTFGDPGEKALLAAYHGEDRDMVRRARLAWALRDFKTENAHRAYLHAALDERLALHRALATLSDRPIVAALWALAARQEDDGRWSAPRWGAQGATDVEVTALALLAFLSFGDTPESGTYSHEVGRAVDFLMRAQKADGLLGSGSMREHALAGTALAGACEAGGRANAPLAAAQRAIMYTGSRQRSYSGWADVAGQAPDAFTTALCVMQLKTARISGLRVDGLYFEGAVRYLETLTITDEGSLNRLLIRPSSGKQPNVRSLACGIVVRRLLGFSQDDPQLARLAAEIANRTGEFMADPWAGYMAKVAAFGCGGDFWQTWCAAERDALPAAQNCFGVDYGLWPPDSEESRRLGLAGNTALRALELDLRYKGYIPLFKRR